MGSNAYLGFSDTKAFLYDVALADEDVAPSDEHLPIARPHPSRMPDINRISIMSQAHDTNAYLATRSFSAISPWHIQASTSSD